jgi:hypothetical protein
MSANGEYYCVAITDRDAARNFAKNNKRDDVVGSDNMFKERSLFEEDFRLALRQFGGLGANDAWCHALSYVANKYGMGITIMKAEAGSTRFSSKHVKADANGNYKPAKCE